MWRMTWHVTNATVMWGPGMAVNARPVITQCNRGSILLRMTWQVYYVQDAVDDGVACIICQAIPLGPP
jgi:hypothetical protein